MHLYKTYQLLVILFIFAALASPYEAAAKSRKKRLQKKCAENYTGSAILENLDRDYLLYDPLRFSVDKKGRLLGTTTFESENPVTEETVLSQGTVSGRVRKVKRVKYAPGIRVIVCTIQAASSDGTSFNLMIESYRSPGSKIRSVKGTAQKNDFIGIVSASQY